MRRSRAVHCVVAALALAGCSINPVTKSTNVVLTSAAEEQRIGAEMAAQVDAQVGLAHDESLQRYVDAIGRRLVSELPDQGVAYRFAVADMKEPNAFALPGGYVYVSRGLLELANSEDELAGVIGHEIGHVAARHHAQQVARAALASPFRLATGLAGALTSVVAPPLGGMISDAGELATGGLLAHYSREQEREADTIGLKLAAGGGWDPEAMSSMLHTLERDDVFERGSERKPSFLDSHPSTPERVADTAAEARTLTRAKRAPIAADDAAFLEKLDGMIVGDDPGAGLFIAGKFVQPALRFSIRFPESWNTRNARSFAAAAAPDGSAMVMLEAPGRADDPMVGAAAINRKMGFNLSDVERLEIAGLPAARYAAVAETQAGPAVAQFTWISYRGIVYQVIVVAPREKFVDPTLGIDHIADSFRPLSDVERGNISETRLRIVRARRGETLRDVLQRSNSAWSPGLAAIANAMEPETVLADGQPVKVAREQPYSDEGR